MHPAGSGPRKSLEKSQKFIRRAMNDHGKELYEFGPFLLDPRKHLLLLDNQPVSLQLKAFETLLVLVRHSEQVVLKDDLMKSVWPDTFVEESNLAQNIFVLRKTLGDTAGRHHYIATIPGRGYRFVARVRVISVEQSLIVQSHERSQVVIEEKKSPRRLWRPVGVAVMAALLGSGVVYWGSHRAPKLTEKDSIVISDFVNSTGDAVFDGALRQGLSAQLEQSPYLNLLSEQRIAQTLSLMAQRKDARLTPELAREVCQRTGSAAVLDGSIAQVGTQYLLLLKATGCANGESLASAEARAKDKDHVLDALGKLASEIRSKLGESLASVQKYDAPPEDATTASLEALKAYSLGYQTMIARNDYPAAIPLFQQAISLDPNFAMAYARLGINFYNLDEPARAAENLQKAYDLRERLTEREKLYIAASHDAMATGNMEAARKTYELWEQLYPRDQFAVGNLGVVYSFLGEYDKALAAIQEAWKLNPGNALVYSNIVVTYLHLNRPDEAKATGLKANALHLDSTFLHANLYVVDFVQHDAAGMEKEAAELIGTPGWEDLMLYYQSDTAAYSGHFTQARELTRRAADSAQRADKKETAAAYEAEAAVREALVGNLDLAKRQAGNALALSNGKEVEALSATALGLAGDSVQTARLDRDLNSRFPQDTVVQSNLLPTIRLAAALRGGASSKLTEALSIATPYELGQTTNSVTFCLYPAYLRGEAFSAAHQGRRAAAEFQKILDHPGVVQNEPIGALAHLEIARGYALEARSAQGTDADAARAKARAAYQDFLKLWKDADPDIPILKQAKAEYAELK
ncbi:MAG: winged helix-turn-helix domain-containing protein [Candidatus Acidiferrales bacterium]